MQNHLHKHFLIFIHLKKILILLPFQLIITKQKILFPQSKEAKPIKKVARDSHAQMSDRFH